MDYINKIFNYRSCNMFQLLTSCNLFQRFNIKHIHLFRHDRIRKLFPTKSDYFIVIPFCIIANPMGIQLMCAYHFVFIRFLLRFYFNFYLFSKSIAHCDQN